MYSRIRSVKITICALSIAIVVANAPARTNAAGPPTVELDNPLGTTDIFAVIGGRIIKPVLGIIGSIALIMFVYGGFVWLTSGGSADKIKTGRDIFVWSSIGLMVILSSYIILKFVFDVLKGAT